MEIISVYDRRFSAYGQVLEGFALPEIIRCLEECVSIPAEGTAYVPSLPELEALPAARALRDRGFGGLEIEIGCCCGHNDRLTCLEYHRTSEIDIAATDMILLLARQPQLEDFRLHTGCVRAFFVPRGTAVELFATTLHYAPCGAAAGEGFCMACVLPRGTNEAPPRTERAALEDRLLWGRNKWVIAGEGTPEAAAGAFVGITGSPVVLDYGKTGGER